MEREKQTNSRTNDANIKINNSSRRQQVWSKRRETQMQLTLEIVNAHSTLQNVISPLLPPAAARSPISSLGRGRSRGASRGRASCMAGQPAPSSPASGCAAAGSARRQSRYGAESSAFLRVQKEQITQLQNLGRQRQCRPRQGVHCSPRSSDSF